MLRWGFALFGVLLSLVLRATVDMYVVATGNNAMLKLPQHAAHGHNVRLGGAIWPPTGRLTQHI
tara:strand:- start:249 stop:440 length:192 start_codon:yes stop_codon:yes gene_type:complete